MWLSHKKEELRCPTCVLVRLCNQMQEFWYSSCVHIEPKHRRNLYLAAHIFLMSKENHLDASVCFLIPMRSFFQKCLLKLCPLLITNAQWENKQLWSKQLSSVAFGLLVFCNRWEGSISIQSWVKKQNQNLYRDCTFASFNFRQILTPCVICKCVQQCLKLGFHFT